MELIRSEIISSHSTSICRISSIRKSVQSENGSSTFAPRAPCSRHPRSHGRPGLTVRGYGRSRFRSQSSRHICFSSMLRPRCRRNKIAGYWHSMCRSYGWHPYHHLYYHNGRLDFQRCSCLGWHICTHVNYPGHFPWQISLYIGQWRLHYLWISGYMHRTHSGRMAKLYRDALHYCAC